MSLKVGDLESAGLALSEDGLKELVSGGLQPPGGVIIADGIGLYVAPTGKKE